MKTWMMNVSLAAVAVALVAVAGGTATASAGAGPAAGQQMGTPPPPPPPGPPGPPGMGGLDGPILDQLGLTTSQLNQIDALRQQARTSAETYEPQLRDIHDKMRAAVETDSFDEGAVRALAAEESPIMIELTVIRARTDSAIYQLLTPEQRTRLASLQKQGPPRR